MIFPGVDAPGYDDEALCRTCPVGLVSLVLILAPVPHVITDVSTSNGPALLGLQPLAHSCPCRKKTTVVRYSNAHAHQQNSVKSRIPVRYSKHTLS